MFSMRYKKLGAKIAYYRKVNGLTQQQLASSLGISASYMSSIERGVSQGQTMALLWSIADTLGIKIEDLIKE
ncbi:MAG: helix-turn-helix transcriptional regulator [Phascolarctobacterium sp.]|nr:helix-turn-helix transcriptional regulator [Phascolarctobacterium sp.]